MSVVRFAQDAGAAILWVAAFLFSLSTLVFLNDHFGRISPGRQIAVYGELPFRDFLDAGYFLPEISSAALQRMFGDNLLGEALLTSVFIATGTLIVFVLARRLTSSTLAGASAAVLALLLLPRAYDYDKVLFYPLGILLCWRYIDRPTPARALVLGAGLMAGALYRYDTGVYIGGAAAVSMAIVHAGDWTTLLRRAGVLITTALCLSLPVLVFLEYNGGLGSAIDQMVTYGRRETARTQITTAPRFTLREAAGTASAQPPTDRRSSAIADVLHAANADVFLFYLFRTLPLIGVAVLLAGLRAADSLPRAEAARLASLLTICVALNVFVLRDPVGARFGGMAGPAAILAAWLVHRVRLVPWVAMRLALTSAITIVGAMTVWSVSMSADWSSRLGPEHARPSHVTGVVRLLAGSPPRLDLLADPHFVALVRYVRECTAPGDRILATWFAPELYFFAQRAFAAGISATFGSHWSDPRFQARSLELLASQQVPLVIARADDDDFRDTHAVLWQYLTDNYRIAGTSDFGVKGGPGYTILVHRGRAASHTHAASSMPCFR